MKEKLKAALRAIIYSDGDPKKIALACALGVFIAFFPIFGTHTLLAFGLAWMFRVSPTITLASTFVNNPWTIAPIYGGALYLGMLLTGTDIHDANINWKGLNWGLFVDLVKLIGIPFVTGCLVAGTVLALASYFFIFRLITAYRLRRAAAGQGPA